MNKTWLRILGVGFSTWAATANASPACMQTYDLGAVGLDEGGGIAMLLPQDDGWIWKRHAAGVTATIANVTLPRGPSAPGYLVPATMWSDATGSVAFVVSGTSLMKLDKSGAHPALDFGCAFGNAPASFAAVHRFDHWSFAVQCDEKTFQVFSEDKSGAISLLAGVVLDSDSTAPVQLAEESLQHYVVTDGTSLVSVSATTTDVQHFASLAPGFVSAPTAMFSDDTGTVVFGRANGNIIRLARDASGTWKAKSEPEPAGLAKTQSTSTSPTLFPTARDTITVVAFADPFTATVAQQLHHDGTAWTLARTRGVSGDVRSVVGVASATGEVSAIVARHVDRFTVDSFEQPDQPIARGEIARHTGQVGACCSFSGNARVAGSSTVMAMMLCVAALLRRRRQSVTR